VIFELMPESFTLYELQRTVEAILGGHLHKQNFRRMIAGTGLVEPTGDIQTETGGRPAKRFAFAARSSLSGRPLASASARADNYIGCGDFASGGKRLGCPGASGFPWQTCPAAFNSGVVMIISLRGGVAATMGMRPKARKKFIS
jgi:hypothetical protein